jgi:hypothetical protein
MRTITTREHLASLYGAVAYTATVMLDGREGLYRLPLITNEDGVVRPSKLWAVRVENEVLR